MAGSEPDPVHPSDFDHWVRPHLQNMRRFAIRLVGVKEADDLLQVALTQAWRKWSTFDAAKGSPVAWLLTIVQNQARRHRLFPELLTLESIDEGAASDQPADVDLERAIARLSQRQRLAVTLHYLLDLNVADAALVMECAPGTVKATLSQARERLREVLGETHE